MNALMRQAYIEYLLHIDMKFNRNDLVGDLCISKACATKDLATYREKFPNNILYDPGTRRYSKSLNFKRLLVYSFDVIHFSELVSLMGAKS